MSQATLSSQLDAERAAILERAATSVFAVESARVRQSAFLWRGGLLVTAAEPLEGAESLRVLQDGSSSEGEVLACDLRTDIAVVRCASAVAPALAPTATPPRVGQTISVVGRAAAGLIASITLFMLWLAESERHLGNWKFVLPPLMLFLSFMMFSGFRYPSFKAIDWKTTKSIPRFLIISVVLVITAMNYEWMPAVLFLAYLLYGVLRPWISHQWRREIEEEIGEEPSEPAEQAR